MIDYGTNVVGGVTPGKGGSSCSTCRSSTPSRRPSRETGADASIVFVPPPFAADSIMEAADAGIRSASAITDGIPAQDMIRVKRYMRRYRPRTAMRLIGPNCAGVISPGRGLLGIMPGHIYLPGRVGIVGRSGTLGYEAAEPDEGAGHRRLDQRRHRRRPDQRLSSFKDILELFEADAETDAVMMIGEIGGPQEAEAADFVRDHMTQAGRRLHRRPGRAQGPQDGPCRRDHLRLRRERPGEGGDPLGCRRHRGAESVGDGRDGRPGARAPRRRLSVLPDWRPGPPGRLFSVGSPHGRSRPVDNSRVNTFIQ